MKWSFAAPVFLAAAFAPSSESVGAEPPTPGPERNIGSQVRSVFAAKCTSCHGSDLAKPKGRFGYVLDLRRVASNPEMVIPSRPDESELWVLVDRGEMPPPDSPHGPLTTAEKESIRAWIAASAPDALPAAPGESGASAGIEPSFPRANVPPSVRALRWMGKLHLLLLHFPIALMLAAAIGEGTSVLRNSRVPSPAVQFCLMLGAVAAVPTVALGWLHAAAGNGVASPQLLTVHRWLGTLAGVWVIGTALWAGRDTYRGVRGRGVRVLLAIGIALVIATAHLGGLIAHGSDFFDW